MNRFGSISILAVCFLAVTATASSFKPASAAAGEKITPEAVMSKHLESIGAKEALTSVNSRIISGTSKFNSSIRVYNNAEGPAVLASEGGKSLIGMTFGLPEYPYEKLGYDGQDLAVGFIKPGVRSILGDFLLAHKVVFKEGLIGGTLSSAWPLLDPTARKAGLEYAGTKKINDRELHVIKYNPKGGSDLNVKLFFDVETFRHVRTEYERYISSPMGRSPDESARQRETRYNMVEEFDDFNKEGGLVLPHTYKIELTILAQTQTGKFEWTLRLLKFEFNQKISPDAFNVKVK